MRRRSFLRNFRITVPDKPCMDSRNSVAIGLVALLISACKQPVDLYCTASEPCAAGLPYCDVSGACTGVANTCISADEVCWDAGTPADGAPGADVPDAHPPDAAPECGEAIECDNGEFCDGQEVCSEQGMCLQGIAPALSDDVDCTIDSCDESNDRVVHEASDSACDNANACDGAESCDPELGCVAGTPVQCPPDTACIVYSCVSASGSCVADDRAYAVDYASPSGAGMLGLTCGGSAVIHTSNTGDCEWSCTCELNAQAQLRMHCVGNATRGGVVCAFRPRDWVDSGCSTSNDGDLQCCFR